MHQIWFERLYQIFTKLNVLNVTVIFAITSLCTNTVHVSNYIGIMSRQCHIFFQETSMMVADKAKIWMRLLKPNLELVCCLPVTFQFVYEWWEWISLGNASCQMHHNGTFGSFTSDLGSLMVASSEGVALKQP